MKRIHLGTGFTVFVLFFGVVVLEAFQTQSWLRVVLWLVIGFGFIAADNRKQHAH